MRLIMRLFRKASYNFIPNYFFNQNPSFYSKDAKQFLLIFARLHIFIKNTFLNFLFTTYKKMLSPIEFEEFEELEELIEELLVEQKVLENINKNR